MIIFYQGRNYIFKLPLKSKEIVKVKANSRLIQQNQQTEVLKKR